MAYLFFRGKKGDAGTLETVGAIILVVIFVLLITGGGQQIWASFREMTSKVKSCEGMGFANGVCVAENEIIDCSVQISGLGCKGDQPICCFKEDSDSSSSVGPVSLSPQTSLNPTSTRLGSTFIISCNTNTQARGCIVVDIDNSLWMCQTETWTSYTEPSSNARVNNVQFSCPAPSPAGPYQVKCRVDERRCTPADPSESSPVTLTVNN